MDSDWKKGLKRLIRKVGRDKVLTGPEDLLMYSYDTTPLRHLPQVVVTPTEVQDVVEAVQFARRVNIPVVPRGAGTGMSGGSVPIQGGLVLNFERMNRILSIDIEKKMGICEPGVVTATFQAEVEKLGLFYPPDPSSYTISTLGGNVAENAGGLRCFKYGVTANYVLGLEFVNAEGEIVPTGYFDNYKSEINLTGILIGSEGTLGAITKVALRLIKKPEYTRTIQAPFSSIERALELVNEVITKGITPAVMEFMDEETLSAVTQYLNYDFPHGVAAVLLIEVDGPEDQASQDGEEIGALCRIHKAMATEYADRPGEQERLWKIRREISPSLARLAPDKINEDVCVPRDQMLSFLKGVKGIARGHDLLIPTFGHAGDGNFHVNIMYDRRDEGQNTDAQIALEEIFDLTLQLGGTLSGEHGIGLVKRDYLKKQYREVELDFMRQVKKAFDPEGLFNPGKIL